MEEISSKSLFECAVNETTFDQYMVSARNGSSSGFGRMMESFRPALTEMAEELLGPRVRRRMSSSDLVQDTLLAVWKEFAHFRGSSLAEFRFWLKDVFHSRLVDGLRRHQQAEKRRQGREDELNSISLLSEDHESPSKVAALREDAVLLLKALEDLPPEQQTIVRMRYLQDCTFEQIAEQLQLSLSSVWRSFQQATETLRRRLQH